MESDVVLIFLVQPPSAPNIKSLLPLNSTSVEIAWTINNDMDVVDYVTIEYMYAGPCNCPDQEMCQWSQFNETATANYSIISNLQEYSRYLFKITAYNQAGSNPPNETNVTTLPAGKC